MMIFAFELLAVFVASVSGALAGRQKDMDLFGMFVVGALTGLGGGTLRSILINDLPPALFTNPSYILVMGFAVLVARWGEPWWSKLRRAVSVIDALSLGMFVSLGIRIAQQHGLAWWACLMCGVITAAFGGVLRDIARAEVPLIFRKEIYATACIAGGLALLGLDLIKVPPQIGVIVITILISTIRLFAIRYSLNQSGE